MFEGTGTVAIFATGNMGRRRPGYSASVVFSLYVAVALGVIHRQLKLLAAIQARNHVI
jgi:hypothetical protein